MVGKKNVGYFLQGISQNDLPQAAAGVPSTTRHKQYYFSQKGILIKVLLTGYENRVEKDCVTLWAVRGKVEVITRPSATFCAGCLHQQELQLLKVKHILGKEERWWWRLNEG